jgi:hypothetical protein
MPSQLHDQVPRFTREAWLTHFAEKYLSPRIEAARGERPRVRVGFPKGRRGSSGHSIGQCWSQEVSADRTCERSRPGWWCNSHGSWPASLRSYSVAPSTPRNEQIC